MVEVTRAEMLLGMRLLAARGTVEVDVAEALPGGDSISSSSITE